MHDLRGLTYHEDWVSEECEANSTPQKAMEVLAGNQWIDVYNFMTEKKVVVVGGIAPSVSATGGYLQGGGHSPMAPLHGLAVDNLLEADIVIADGSLLTISKCSHPDLFFAIRGGGGGTYGIITRAVYKAHEKQANYVRYDGVLFATDSSPGSNERLMRAYVDWVAWTHENQPGLWGGYVTFGPEVGGNFIYYIVWFYGEQSEGDRAIQILDQLQANGDTFYIEKSVQNSDTWDWFMPQIEVTGINRYITSRLIPEDNFASEEEK